MKNKFLFVAVMLLASFLMIGKTNAEKINLEDYATKTLEEVFKDEGIERDLTKFDGDNKITIYVFRGNGCPHCSDFFNYVNDTLLDKYGKNINFVTFETWYDANNVELMNKVGTFLKYDVNSQEFGIPFIIIGDKSFAGYGSSYNSDIEDAIENLIDSEEKYDVFEEMAKEKVSTNTSILVFWNILITSIATLVIVLVSNRNRKLIMEKLRR